MRAMLSFMESSEDRMMEKFQEQTDKMEIRVKENWRKMLTSFARDFEYRMIQLRESLKNEVKTTCESHTE
jgi:hypothetical protein